MPWCSVRAVSSPSATWSSDWLAAWGCRRPCGSRWRRSRASCCRAPGRSSAGATIRWRSARWSTASRPRHDAASSEKPEVALLGACRDVVDLRRAGGVSALRELVAEPEQELEGVLDLAECLSERRELEELRARQVVDGKAARSHVDRVAGIDAVPLDQLAPQGIEAGQMTRGDRRGSAADIVVPDAIKEREVLTAQEAVDVSDEWPIL